MGETCRSAESAELTSHATLMPMFRSTSSERGELESALSLTPGELDLFSVIACRKSRAQRPGLCSAGSIVSGESTDDLCLGP